MLNTSTAFSPDAYTVHDREAICALADFLPEKIFDAHAHIYHDSFAPLAASYGAPSAGLQEYCSLMQPLLNRPQTLRLNMIPYVDPLVADRQNGALQASDRFLLQQLALDDGNVGELLVLPDETPESIEKRLTHPTIRGLKCYHLFSNAKNAANCTPGEFLPESAWQIANDRQMYITLHLVRSKSLADEENVSFICRMAKKYPDAKLILAHAARSFAAWTAIESIDKILHLDNVLFDFSAICESPAMAQILKKAGVSRCMWGSDFPICTLRGKPISLADGFYWINENDLARFGMPGWLIAIENLMAVRQACALADLSRADTEALFYGTAAKLLGKV